MSPRLQFIKSQLTPALLEALIEAPMDLADAHASRAAEKAAANLCFLCQHLNSLPPSPFSIDNDAEPPDVDSVILNYDFKKQ